MLLLDLLLFPVLAWLVPGYFLSRWLFPVSTPLERTATTLLLGVIGMVPLVFLPIYLLQTPITMAWVLGAAAALTASAVLLRRFRPCAALPASVGHAAS